MLGQSYNLLLFFGCVVISDLYLFRDDIFLNPQFKFSKNLMFFSIYNVALLTFLAHNKSSSTSQLIKGKSSDFLWNPSIYLWLIVNQDAWDQDAKILRCLSGIVTFLFRSGAGCLLAWYLPAGQTGVCAICTSLLPSNFFLFLSDLLFEASSLTLSISCR